MALARGHRSSADSFAYCVVGLAQAFVDAARAGSDLLDHGVVGMPGVVGAATRLRHRHVLVVVGRMDAAVLGVVEVVQGRRRGGAVVIGPAHLVAAHRSEEHTSELQSLMRISYAVFCLKKNT